MRKLFSFILILSLILGLGQAFALQVDDGKKKSDSKIAFVVVRYARSNAVGTNGNMISKDRVVVWDTTSNDGVTVNLSTTSYDSAVAGVTIDDIPGISDDNSAADDLSNNNWGRMQVYGRHSDVSWDASTIPGTGGGAVPAGIKVAVSAKLGGTAGVLRDSTSGDSTTLNNASKDSFGFLLESPATTDKTADIFIKTM